MCTAHMTNIYELYPKCCDVVKIIIKNKLFPRRYECKKNYVDKKRRPSEILNYTRETKNTAVSRFELYDFALLFREIFSRRRQSNMLFAKCKNFTKVQFKYLDVFNNMSNILMYLKWGRGGGINYHYLPFCVFNVPVENLMVRVFVTCLN